MTIAQGDVATVDRDAVAIGLLYRKSQLPSDNRIFYFADAGQCLLRKKQALGRGHWQNWIKVNHSVLGFSERGACSLLHGTQWLSSNWRLITQLEDIATDPRPSEQDLARAKEIRELISSQVFRPAHIGTYGVRGNEWYTPAEYIALARAVLGDIDLDPASCIEAQQTVKDLQYFDAEQNGLCHAWYGRVWLNAPYSRPLMRKFIGKLLMEWDAGRITEAIVLTHNFTDAAWFHDVAAIADCMCFTQGRVKFDHPGGTTSKPPHGQVFFYFGPKIELFKDAFGRVGLIARPEPDSWSRRRVRHAV
jgi:hypothetical protein